MLTKRQLQALVFIRNYIDKNVVSPSYDEIAGGIGGTTKSNAHRIVACLEAEGYICKKNWGNRAIKVLKMPEGWQMYARRVDDNQGEIIAAFRKLGYSVRDTSRMGGGFPDLVVSTGQHCGSGNYLIEVKDGRKPPSARKLTPAEQRFKNEWRGQYTIIESVEDVIAFDRGMR